MLHAATQGMLGSTLHALNPYAVAGIVAALIVGGMVKGIVSIGVPLVAMPILSQMMPVKQAVLLLSMPVILGNIPQALEGGETVATARRMAAPLIGTVLGNIVGVSILISLEPHHAQAAAGGLLVFAALLLRYVVFRKDNLLCRYGNRRVKIVVLFATHLTRSHDANGARPFFSPSSSSSAFITTTTTRTGSLSLP